MGRYETVGADVGAAAFLPVIVHVFGTCDLELTLFRSTIGLLNKLYKYSTLSYVGGAFKTGLHNILEAAVYGVPLFFGPKYSHFNEAVMLVQKGGAFPVNNAGEMWQVVQRFEDNPEAYARVCAVCREYVAANVGACERIYQQIFECV